MTVGVAVMVFSFRQTVAIAGSIKRWSPIFSLGRPRMRSPVQHSFMPPEAIRFLEADPAVEAIDTFRAVDLPFRDQTISVAVVRGSDRRNLRFFHGDNDQIMQPFYSEQCVLVSESFARPLSCRGRRDAEVADASGLAAFPIAGVFYDYTSDQGTVFLSERNFQALWHDDRVNSVAVYLKPGASPAAIADDFRPRFSRRGEFSIYSNRVVAHANLRNLRSDFCGHLRPAHDRGRGRGRRNFPRPNDPGGGTLAGTRRLALDRRLRRRRSGGCSFGKAA